MSDLPPDLQRQLHYDPSAARALLQDESARAQAKKARALEAWRAANCRLLNGAIVETRTLQCLTGTVVTVAPFGVPPKLRSFSFPPSPPSQCQTNMRHNVPLRVPPRQIARAAKNVKNWIPVNQPLPPRSMAHPVLYLDS